MASITDQSRHEQAPPKRNDAEDVPCVGSAPDHANAADLMVIFGITGDLARKMTLRALYRLERRGLLDCPIIGVGCDELSSGRLCERAREAICGAGETVEDAIFDKLVARLSYLHGDVCQDDLYDQLAGQVGGHRRLLFYPEMPPALFGPIVEHLAAARLLEHGRAAVEKPFGRDLASARELDARLHEVLSEDQIPRVDHFLGKKFGRVAGERRQRRRQRRDDDRGDQAARPGRAPPVAADRDDRDGRFRADRPRATVVRARRRHPGEYTERDISQQVKWIKGVKFIGRFSEIGGGYEGYNQDHEFFGYRQSI